MMAGSAGFGKRLPDGSRSKAIVLAAITDAANAGLPCPTNEALAELLGGFALSSPPQIIARLEAAGLIKVERYQRGRRVTIVTSGKATAMVCSPAVHWRDRPMDVPAPAAHAIRMQRPNTAQMIMSTAQRLDRAPSDFLADLVWIGWARWQEDASTPGASEGMI